MPTLTYKVQPKAESGALRPEYLNTRTPEDLLLVHFRLAGADSAAIEVELHVGMIC